MPVTTIAGHEIHVDDEGFMTEYTEWDEGLAAALADAIGVEMSDDAAAEEAAAAHEKPKRRMLQNTVTGNSTRSR